MNFYVFMFIYYYGSRCESKDKVIRNLMSNYGAVEINTCNYIDTKKCDIQFKVTKISSQLIEYKVKNIGLYCSIMDIDSCLDNPLYHNRFIQRMFSSY